MRFGLWMASAFLLNVSAAAVADSTVTGSGGGFSGSGTLLTTSNGDGSYTITGITGTDVLGLIAPNGFNGNDNQLFPSATTLVDSKGFAFNAAEGDTQYEVDLFAAPGSQGGYQAAILDSDDISQDITVSFALDNGSTTSRRLVALPGESAGEERSFGFNFAAVTPVAATPEPTTFALLGTGFLGLAGVIRRRSRQPGSRD